MTEPTRSCGPCTECCRVIQVDDVGDGFSKPADQLCVNCTATGCGIYDTRYEVCRTFQCGWLSDRRELLRERDRPDRSGIIITAPGELCPPILFGRKVLVAHECAPGAAEMTPGSTLIDRLTRRGYVVVVAARSTDSRIVRANDPAIADKVWRWLLREASHQSSSLLG